MPTRLERAGAPRLIAAALLVLAGLCGPATPALGNAPAPALAAPPPGLAPPGLAPPGLAAPGLAAPGLAAPGAPIVATVPRGPASPGVPELTRAKAAGTLALAERVPEARWQLEALGAAQAWKLSTGAGITVAVIDSGVDASHPGLDGQVLPGRDLVDGTTDGRTDPVGHGTTVASLIAGHAYGDNSAAGLAPDATILPIRVLDEENRYQDATTVAAAVVWAVEQGAQVINLSLGGVRRSEALASAIELARSHDVVVIACTGNGDSSAAGEVWYPAREPGVIAVTGLAQPAGDGATELWSGSLTGPETVLAAPAVLIGAGPGGGYRQVQGTSFAAALVTATAALIRARWPDLPAADVVNRLITTARDLGEPGRDSVYGFGALDPVAALTAEVPPVDRHPLLSDRPPGLAGLGAAPAPAAASGDSQRIISLSDVAAGQPAGAARAAPAHPRGSDRLRPGPLAAGLLLAVAVAITVVVAHPGLRRRVRGRRGP